jgi:hypothetical protein
MGGATKGIECDGPGAAGGCEEGGDGGDQSKERLLKVSQY